MKRKPVRSDISGQVFGRLTVTSLSELRGRSRVYWLCVCTCGVEKWVIADALKSGGTKSCGCLHAEGSKPIHGHGRPGRQSPEYTVWHSMKQRCLTPTNQRYLRYGGRGIRVCERWLEFEKFMTDMGARPPGASIDRINNDGDYEPSNCRWASIEQQARNSSRNHWIEFAGERLCVTDWSRKTGIPYATLHCRLNRWSVERALTTPAKGATQ